jgi:archaellum component FlaC
MSETLIQRLDRIESEIEKLKIPTKNSSNKKLPDIKSEVEKVVDIAYINNLYRNK